METKPVPMELIVLFAAVAHTASLAQSNSTAPNTSASQIGVLLNARKAEINALRPGDRDTEAAVDAMVKQLKRNPRLQETIVAPCPSTPGPAPAGMSTRALAVAKPDSWAERMPVYVKAAEDELRRDASLSDAQKTALTLFVAPRFREPGQLGKFETIVLPGCPSPAPPPAGHSVPPAGVKR